MKMKLSHVFSGVAAIILLQTLFFKFTAAPESVAIFSMLGVEPWGRWLSGVMELVAAILILYPATRFVGALMTQGIMFGAVLSHIFILGIAVAGDGGLLFLLALVVLFSSFFVLWIHKSEAKRLIQLLS